MANSNNICTRFINYVAVLILVFLSSQSFAAGGSFGGGGASGDWGEPDKCEPQFAYSYPSSIVGSPPFIGQDLSSLGAFALADIQPRFPGIFSSHQVKQYPD